MLTGFGGVHMREWMGLAAALTMALAGPAMAASPLQFAPATPLEGAKLVAKGQRVGTVLGCIGCHTPDLSGQDFTEDAKRLTIWSSNLTLALPHYSDAALERTLRTGKRPDGSAMWAMPSATIGQISAPDMKALIAWLRTMPPKGVVHPAMVWGPDGPAARARGEIESSPEEVAEYRRLHPVDLGAATAHGRYLVTTVCSGCHGPQLKGHKDEPHVPDLMIAASYDLPAFRHLLKTGEPMGEKRNLGLMGMVAKYHFSRLTDDEVADIHAYLVARAAHNGR